MSGHILACARSHQVVTLLVLQVYGLQHRSLSASKPDCRPKHWTAWASPTSRSSLPLYMRISMTCACMQRQIETGVLAVIENNRSGWLLEQTTTLATVRSYPRVLDVSILAN